MNYSNFAVVRPITLQGLLKLFLLPQELTSASAGAMQLETEEEVVVTDLEATGYQASFSKLGASESNRRNPIDDQIDDARQLLTSSLARACEATPGVVRFEWAIADPCFLNH